MSPTAITPEQFSTFGELLRHLRRQARITQRELAIAVGYSDTQISRLEQNQRVPDAATLTALFVPALYIEDQPKWVARLLELAKAAQVEDESETEVMAGFPTGTVTFLFTDIEGSTNLARQYPDAMLALLAQHHEILNQCIQAHSGYAFQIVGDSVSAAFHSASDALNAALDAQRYLQNEVWSPAPIKVRMGIHTGTAHLQDASKALRYSGYATLALTQRIMSAGHGGQILLSQSTYDLTRDAPPENAQLVDLGKHRLKDALQPEHLYQLTVPDLPSEFPPLNTIKLFTQNLPGQLTSFVGREKEMAEIKGAIDKYRLVTLTGPGGTGKTRLSIQAASEVVDQYPDGVWMVELAPILDPLLVPRTTAIAIGLRDEPQRPVIDMLCDYLREKQMLIILDNCEHLVDACAHMADRLLRAAPKLRILVTSREALGILGEMTHQVPSLALPDLEHLPSIESLSQYEAVQLFIERAGAALSTFTVTTDNAAALAQICHHLDGMPLAIELAAAKIRVLSLEQIAARLDDRFRLLTSGSRTALERHQTLRAAIDWSYNLLSPAEQTLFRRLSIFIGGWTPEAAEAVCEDRLDASLAQNKDVLSLLEELINKSLVIKDEIGHVSRYRMLETIRQYANEKLLDAGESDALRDRHLEYFLQLAETAAPHLIRPEQLEWLAQLDRDYENVRFAFEWALSKESPELSLQLCAALGKFWDIRSYWLEGSRWLKSALSKPSQDPGMAEKAARVKALYQDAELAGKLDDLERMKSSAELSLALAQEGSDKWDIAIAKFYAGLALYRRDDFEHALPLMHQSLAEFRELGDPYWESYSQRYLSGLLVNRGELPYIESALQNLELARKAGERLNLAEALFDFYWLYADESGEPRKYAEEANMLFQQIGSNMSWAAFEFAEIAWLKGDYQQARTYYVDLEERFRILGEKKFRFSAIALLGLLAQEEGYLTESQAYLEEALANSRECGWKNTIVWHLAGLSVTLYLQRNVDRFKQLVRESISLAKGLSKVTKIWLLVVILNALSLPKPDSSACILGSVDTLRRENGLSIGTPLVKRYCDRAESNVRKALGNTAFELAFAEGQKMPVNAALDLVLKTVEEM